MEHITYLGLGLLFVSAVGAGVMNAMAGGGTLLTFPSLLAAGVSPVMANATNAVALVPGSFTSGFTYRRELGQHGPRLVAYLIASSVLGGCVGALLVAVAGDALFRRLVPGLIIGSTVLFILQEPLRRWRERRAAAGHVRPAPGETSIWGLAVAHFLVSVYGGFFGAGMGILMLAELGFVGLTNMHQMNALKNFGAAFINLTAALTFIAAGLVFWRLAALMAVGAIFGGWAGARLAQRIGQGPVRWVVVAIGLTTGVATLLR
ncbi:MAG: sulfite exporter TauE/SafE family protein [Myxococcaceae bacterium]